jgi:uncharacterized MAPEG superfamily protein
MLSIVYLSKVQHVLYSVYLLHDYDNVNASFKKGAKEEDSVEEQTVSRAYNAHLNNWEAFTGFAAAVLVALQAKVESKTLTKLCNAFLVSRVAYTLCYPLAFNFPLSVVRSGIFIAGISVVNKIFSLSYFGGDSPSK